MTTAINRLKPYRNGRYLMARPEKWAFEYDPDATFPEVEFGLGLTVQLVWVTPELASEWLAKIGKNSGT